MTNKLKGQILLRNFANATINRLKLTNDVIEEGCKLDAEKFLNIKASKCALLSEGIMEDISYEKFCELSPIEKMMFHLDFIAASEVITNSPTKYVDKFIKHLMITKCEILERTGLSKEEVIKRVKEEMNDTKH